MSIAKCIADKTTKSDSSCVVADWNAENASTPGFILNKPTIPAAQVQADWNATSGVSSILNKPTLSTSTGELIGIWSRFTSGSNISVTPPIGTTKARILVQGGGGGAGFGYGGGGAGAYAEALREVVGNLNVTVGASTGASSVSGSGFTTITATGGADAIHPGYGKGGIQPTTGDINIAGQSGVASYYGGSGGGNLYAIAGSGGSNGSGSFMSGTTGQNGLFGGGGGCGGYGMVDGNPAVGGLGSGGEGFVIIYWYK